MLRPVALGMMEIPVQGRDAAEMAQPQQHRVRVPQITPPTAACCGFATGPQELQAREPSPYALLRLAVALGLEGMHVVGLEMRRGTLSSV